MADPRNLPSHQLALSMGLNTQFTPEAIAGKFLVTAQNVDTFDRFQRLGKVPGSTRVSPDHGSAVVSLHQFEYTDLLFDRQREQLSLAGGSLRRIDSVGAMTVLTTGLVDEDLAEAVMFDRIHLTSPGQRGLVTGGIKWDGSTVTNWGVLPPGSVPTVVQALDTHTNWTPSADVILSTDVLHSQDGVASVQVDKFGTATTFADITRAALALDVTGAGSDTGFIWLFVPGGSLSKLAAGTAVSVTLGTAGFTNSFEYNFSVGDLFPGWNLLSFVFNSPSTTNGTGATLSNVTDIRLRIVFSGTGQTQLGYLWDSFFINDEGAVTATEGIAGAPNGTYSYRTTFLTETGLESNAGPVSTSLTVSGIAATGILTAAANVSNLDTVTLGGKTYTFQTVLTDVDGNVLIGASASDSLDNLIDAINLGPTAGTDYALSTTIHPTISALAGAGDTIDTTANTNGTAGNTLNQLETGANLSWDNPTMTGGANGNQIDLTAIPTSPDGSVIARRIYRDINADQIYRFVAQIDDNITTTFADNVGDASLGSTSPPLAGDAFLDNSVPGRFKDCAVYQNRIFGIVADNPTVLGISNAGAPEAFPIVEQLQIEEELTALENHALGLILYATDKVFLLTGDGITSPIRIEEVTNQAGANGRRSTLRVKGLNFVVRESEVFLMANPSDPWHINGNVLDQFKALQNSNLEDLHMVHDRSRFRVVFFAKTTSVYDQIFVYQYGTMGFQQITGEGSGTDPQDLRTGSWTKIVLPTSINPQCSVIAERTADLPELWVGGNDGYVYFLQDPAATTWAENTGAAAIDSQFECSAVPIGTSRTGRGEPRYLRVNGSSTGASVWTVTITLLTDAEGSVIGTPSTFTITLGAGDTSPIVPIPEIGDRGEWCKVKLENAVSGDGGAIKSLELFYLTRSDFRGPRVA